MTAGAVLRGTCNSLMRGVVKGYRWFVSPVLPARCRYLPTCSEYALEALDRHGPARGSWLALKRIARCHPFAAFGGGAGFDPVPSDHGDHTHHAHHEKG